MSDLLCNLTDWRAGITELVNWKYAATQPNRDFKMKPLKENTNLYVSWGHGKHRKPNLVSKQPP